VSWQPRDRASGFELGRDGPSSILVGVDGSESSLRALAYAVGLTRRQRSRLVAVYVRSLTTTVLAVADRTGGVAEAYRQTQDEIESELRTLFSRSCQWGIDAHLLVTDGDPLATLSAVAGDLRADAVIIGASASLRHRLAGSLAVRLVRSRRWPVTVVP
jgi:nucleotide-binding universal stress UspA family protein